METGIDRTARAVAHAVSRRDVLRALAAGFLLSMEGRKRDARASGAPVPSLPVNDLVPGAHSTNSSVCPGDGTCTAFRIDFEQPSLEPDVCTQECFSAQLRHRVIEAGAPSNDDLAQQVVQLRQALVALGFATTGKLQSILLRNTAGAPIRETTIETFLDDSGQSARMNFTTDFDDRGTRSWTSVILVPERPDSTLILSVAGEILSLPATELSMESQSLALTDATWDGRHRAQAPIAPIAAQARFAQGNATPISTAACTRFFHQICAGVEQISCEILFGRIFGKALSLGSGPAETLISSFAPKAVAAIGALQRATYQRVLQLPLIQKIPASVRAERVDNIFDAVNEIVADRFHDITGLPSLCDIVHDVGCGSTDSDALLFQCCGAHGGHSCGSVCCPSDAACGPGGSGTCGCDTDRLCGNDICCAPTHVCQAGICVEDAAEESLIEVNPELESEDDSLDSPLTPATGALSVDNDCPIEVSHEIGDPFVVGGYTLVRVTVRFVFPEAPIVAGIWADQWIDYGDGRTEPISGAGYGVDTNRILEYHVDDLPVTVSMSIAAGWQENGPFRPTLVECTINYSFEVTAS